MAAQDFESREVLIDHYTHHTKIRYGILRFMGTAFGGVYSPSGKCLCLLGSTSYEDGQNILRDVSRIMGQNVFFAGDLM